MSSYTKNKLEYLKGTKQLIREAIEEKGQMVTDSDSFRSYADKIANIETGADVSGVTATAADVRQGKVIVDAQGNEVVGTLVVEQKAPDVIWVGKDSVANAQVGTGVVRYVTFMNDDGTVTYGQKSVLVGTDCIEPVAGGYMDAPTKESTAEHTFTFSGGWATEPNGGKDSNALKNVTEDRTVYANFIAAVRYYTVSFYDGETLVHTESVPYGGSSTYQHIKGDYIFQGWTPEPTNITGDLACYGSWIESVDFADASWETIIRVSESGMASTLFKIGDQKQLTCTAPNGVTQTVTMQIVGFDQDTLKDGTKVGITLLSLPPSENNWIKMNDTSKTYSWPNSDLYKKLYTVTLPSFPEDLRNGIKFVKKITRKWVDGTDSTGQDSWTNRIWIPSLGEFDITKVMYGDNPYAEDDGIKYTYDYKTLWDNRNVWFRSGNYKSSNQVYTWAAARVQAVYAVTSNDVVFGFCV